MTPPANWPARLGTIARLRVEGWTWQNIALHFKVSNGTMSKVNSKYAEQIKALTPVAEVPVPVIQPEIVVAEDGVTVKRYPARWAEGAEGQYTVKPRGKRGERGD